MKTPAQICVASVFAFWLWAQLLSAQVVLYDGALGTLPAAQGWQYLANPIIGNMATQTLGAGFVTLDSTSPITDQAGYFSANPIFPQLAHPNMPVIDRLAGYDVRFVMRLNSENHALPPGGDDNGDGVADRAGFSVIAISQDLLGIELGFWTDRIWAQDDDQVSATNFFTQAEGVALDTGSALLKYDLRVYGSGYQIVRGGGVAPVLSGRLRDYTSFTGTVDPYELPSFLFFGDNTTRGEASVSLGRIEVRDLPSPGAEVDALVAEIVSGTNNPFDDLTGDGLVNQADLTAWLSAAGEFRLGAGRAYLPGDANLDGVVDGQDFIVWNTHKFMPTAAWTSGDFNADGITDGQDFIVWNTHKFLSSGATSAVPESGRASLWLGAVALLMLGLRNRQGCSPPGSNPVGTTKQLWLTVCMSNHWPPDRA